ncbi:hypothetical protein V7O61_15165 [Methanolobus sp. WCC1]|nr:MULTISPECIES: hypothetical protein [Methanolobus]
MGFKYQVAETKEPSILGQKAPYSRAIAMPFGFTNSKHESIAVSVDANC